MNDTGDEASGAARLRNLDAAAVFRLSGWPPRVILAWFIGTQTLLAIANLSGVYAPWPTVIGLVLTTGAACLVTLVNRHPYPRLLVFVVWLVVIVVTALVDWNLPPGWPGYASWQWGALTFVLFVMALRGRISSAWIGFVLMAGITVAWAISDGQGWLDGVNLLIRHAGMLLIATLFALSLRGAARALRRIGDAQLALTESTAVLRAGLAEHDRELAVLDDSTRAALERLASGAPVAAEERELFRTLEAAVRDRLRARGLLTPAIVAAARSARDRGVEVLLLDDRGNQDLDDSTVAALESVVAAAASRMDADSLTVRLLPPGRDDAATVVVSHGDGSTRFVV